MAFRWIIWDDEDDPRGNVQHIAEHGITTDEVESVVNGPTATIRDIEYGRDTKLSSVQAIADALRLELDLVNTKVEV